MFIVKALIAIVIGFALWAIAKLVTSVFGGQGASLPVCIIWGAILSGTVISWLFGL